MDKDRSKRRKSTNPFDSSSDEESSSVDVFHDCHDASTTAKKREALLDFNFTTAPAPENPALNFNVLAQSREATDFFSPLESAMLRAAGEESDVESGSSFLADEDEDENDEEPDIPTTEESRWLTLMRKASGNLIGSGPLKPNQNDVLQDSSHGQISRRGSQASFVSARSADSGNEESIGTSTPSRRESFMDEHSNVASPGGSVEGMTTPTRRGSFKGDTPKSLSPGGRRGSLRKRRSMRKQKRTPVIVAKANPVLEKLQSDERDTDLDATAAPWTKMILLEELGTASSWTVLFLPYIAFIIAVLIDTHSAFMVSSVGPLSATSSCANASATRPFDVPILPAAEESCSYPFALKTGHQGVLSSGKNSYLFQSFHYKDLMKTGTAFTSGPIEHVSPMSTFLTGDVYFHDLSTEAVAMVAKGAVLVSALVLQWTPAEWIPVFVSKPQPLSMACKPNTLRGEVPSLSSLWNCSSPRNLDVVFPMPGTGVLSGEELQVYFLYSWYDPTSFLNTSSLVGSAPYTDIIGHSSFVYNDSPAAKDIWSEINVSQSKPLIPHIVRSSSCVVEHESQAYAELKISVRLVTLIFSFCFTVFWCWSLGCKGFFAGAQCCCATLTCQPCRRDDEDTVPLTGRHKASWLWWESPWIVFPERRYLFVLLICLMLIQNPLLAFAYFQQQLYGRARVHAIADIMIGIGVHGFLMMWLCLVQGVRYHTAAFARRRVKQARQLLELRKAAKYVASSENENYGTDEHVSKYLSDYFDEFGDVEGTITAGSTAIRLKSDPCGDSWADFLLPKLMLLAVGVASVVLTAVCRFPGSIDVIATLTPMGLHRLNSFYVIGSVIQLFVLLCWVFLILRNAFLTGAKLRKEPFLSTRPAQLAYRVLFGMLILGVGALLIPLLIDLCSLIEKWTHGQKAKSHTDLQARDRSPIVEIFLRILWTAGQRVPYSGTASSIGPGKLLFITTIALVSAYIFLPSRPYFETENEPAKKDETLHVVGDEKMMSLALVERMRQRRDKRVVVGLARNTHTWRSFPLPIKKPTVASKLLLESSFQLNRKERSAVYIGRYTPVFCVEIACWLLEASWQAYYSPKDFSLDDWAPGRIDLESIGLRLEHSIVDETLHTQAYVASNLASQVDGEEDSIIVVAFRGTASTRNMKTDLTFRQVPLFSQIMGTDEQATFQVRSDRIDAYDRDGRFWATPMTKTADVISMSPMHAQEPETSVFNWHDDRQSSLAAVSSGAKAVIGAVPMARQALPCVHEGFLEAYSHIRRQVMESVLDVLQRQFSKTVARSRLSADSGDERTPMVLPKIYITGHSLGGSLGQLLALDLAANCELVVDVEIPENDGSKSAEDFFLLPSPVDTSPETRAKHRSRLFSFDEPETSDDDTTSPNVCTLRLQPPIAVYTYGQPRVGNHAFARIYKQRVPHTFRVACEGDAFTTMPPTLLCGWSGIYKHAGLEVMLDEGLTGNILVGPTVVETLFRFTKVRTSVAAHSLERYRDSLASALRQDELEEYYRGHGILKEDRESGLACSSSSLPEWLTHIKRSDSEEY